MSGPLADRPFSYREARDRVLLFHRGRHVVTLAGRDAARFLIRVADADEDAAQQLMARATGNFRRGNERGGRR